VGRIKGNKRQRQAQRHSLHNSFDGNPSTDACAFKWKWRVADEWKRRIANCEAFSETLDEASGACKWREACS
jgi:hypothetical protein